MSYENAPSTILLATACACCGRALRDAISVETGVGPECRERFSFDEAQGTPNWVAATELMREVAKESTIFVELLARFESREFVDARSAVNVLVHHVAHQKSNLDNNIARKIFSSIAMLGYTVLADRIAKRFRETIDIPANVCTIHEDCKTNEELARACKADQKAREVKPVVTTSVDETTKLRRQYGEILAAFTHDGNITVADFNALVKAESPASPAEFVEVARKIVCDCKRCNASGRVSLRNGWSKCFRCDGKGHQTVNDAFRNRAYDAYRRAGNAA